MSTAVPRRVKRQPEAKEESPEIRVSVVIYDFDCAPEEITRLLGIQPTRSWRLGDPVSYADRLLPGASAPKTKQNTWILDGPRSNSPSLAEHAERLIEIVMPAASRFKKLPQGTGIALNCAVYDYERRAILEFSNETLRALALIGADISMSYYDMTDWED